MWARLLEPGKTGIHGGQPILGSEIQVPRFLEHFHRMFKDLEQSRVEIMNWILWVLVWIILSLEASFN